ncbi:unnamed protein product [Orchesella dallaii]|uniref:Uncharacterized protein n=1 Tax=Orchesella dallaii TaxID=48710 RepID=A0ABP1QUI0_9HEXA
MAQVIVDYTTVNMMVKRDGILVLALLLFGSLVAKEGNEGICTFKTCEGCTTAHCWFCGTGSEMRCVLEQWQCPNFTMIVIPPDNNGRCPLTTTSTPPLSTTTTTPTATSSILVYIATVAISAAVGFALAVLLIALWFNRQVDRVRSMQSQPVDGSPANVAYVRLEEAVVRGDICVERGVSRTESPIMIGAFGDSGSDVVHYDSTITNNVVVEDEREGGVVVGELI